LLIPPSESRRGWANFFVRNPSRRNKLMTISQSNLPRLAGRLQLYKNFLSGRLSIARFISIACRFQATSLNLVSRPDPARIFQFDSLRSKLMMFANMIVWFWSLIHSINICKFLLMVFLAVNLKNLPLVFHVSAHSNASDMHASMLACYSRALSPSPREF